MREPNEQLPSKRESSEETIVRLKVLDQIVPKLIPFSEAILLVGSVAYGQNYSVRKESDIDLIIMINRLNVNSITEAGLFTVHPQYKEAITLFKKEVVDHFTIKEYISNVEVQFHFWDKEAHFRAERMESPAPKSYKSMRPVPKYIYNIDFEGKRRATKVGKVKIYKYGIVYSYPSFFIVNDHFVPKEPILNLITCPKILYLNDSQLQKNIDQIWKFLAARLVKEYGTNPDLGKASIIKSIYGNWNLSPTSRKELERRQRQEISRISRT